MIDLNDRADSRRELLVLDVFTMRLYPTHRTVYGGLTSFFRGPRSQELHCFQQVQPARLMSHQLGFAETWTNNVVNYCRLTVDDRRVA